MMKYIDRPNAYINATDLELAIVKATCYGDALSAVREAPSIDIVCCGECRCWIDDRKSEEDMGTCGLTHYFTEADDFCSYGERSSE